MHPPKLLTTLLFAVLLACLSLPARAADGDDTTGDSESGLTAGGVGPIRVPPTGRPVLPPTGHPGGGPGSPPGGGTPGGGAPGGGASGSNPASRCIQCDRCPVGDDRCRTLCKPTCLQQGESLAAKGKRLICSVVCAGGRLLAACGG